MQSKFEAKFGKYAIRNLSLWLVVCYAVGYMIQILGGSTILQYLYLDPYMILHKGQVWRLVTWLVIPPDSFSFWTLLILYFYYSIGTSLEYTWGTYRYNVYLFSGFLFTILGSFILYGVFTILGIQALTTVYSVMFTTYYVNMSIFLAYATTFPDAMVYIFFVLPIKVKYLGIIYGALILYEFLQYVKAGGFYIAMCVVIAASLLNFIIFFITSRKKVRFNTVYSKRGMQFQKRSEARKQAANAYSQTTRMKSTGSSNVTRHKCAQCGATEVTNPELQFRFCSKCNGNYEYCEKHIFTHIHVQ